MNKLECQHIANEIADEAISASSEYPPFHSPHEGIAIILEEFEELKIEVFKKQASYNMRLMRKEAVQLGAMALRFIYDLT
ncbi:MAG TPA: hypothetical protein VMW45_03690 [Dehalococcoidia bacterium]|nr:hypothetical protein [Dehalococcoidia bacterium]